MDGTLIAPEFTDWVWNHGIPRLYAEKTGLSYDSAKAYVEGEYRKVGEKALEWYDIKYWFRFLGLNGGWKPLMERFAAKISVYSDVKSVLEQLKERFPLILTSNAAREFIDLEMETAGLIGYFQRTFSATSDFGRVKKTPDFYKQICVILDASPWEIVHVGDHYEFDCVVPRTLGVQAFHLDRSFQRQGDFVIRDLRDLESRLPLAG
jgi:putative hydrolase of the HAD superfamily